MGPRGRRPGPRCEGGGALAGSARRRLRLAQPLKRQQIPAIPIRSEDFAAQWMRAGLHDDRSKWGHVMGLTRLLSRPHTREQEPPWTLRRNPRTRRRRPSRRAAAAGDGHRVREPEGRRREDDVDAEPGRRARRGGQPRPVRRHGPAGQPDDEPGPEPGLDRALDVRRPRPPAPDPERDRAHGDRPGRLLDRPRRSGARPLEHDRPRARSREGAERGQGELRLRPHRHAAVTRPADDQRARCIRSCDRPGPVRVPLAARPRPAREHARDDPGEPEPERVDHGHPADDVRPTDAALRARRSRSSRRTSATSSSRRGSGRRSVTRRRP